MTVARERLGEIGRELRKIVLAERLHLPNAVRIHPFIVEPKWQHFNRQSGTLIKIHRTRGTVELNGERFNIPLGWLAIDDEQLGIMLGLWLA